MQKITAESPESKSPDLAAENLAQLKALFPELVTESKDGVVVNVDVLKQLVGDKVITDSEEKYGLNWHGKRRARQIALTPSTGTLRPCPAESVDWDTTKNLMIEGDNLEVLKLLQKSYAGKVKLIYIDPPYNTGKDFVYPDNFQDNIKNYLEITGQVGEGGRKISSNTEASGRFHTDWMNMLYPRLKLARNLLREDGIIFISIDDSEVNNLRQIGDEIFGEENFVASVIWEKKFSPQNDDKYLTEAHDYIVLYAKSKEAWRPSLLPRSEEQMASFTNPDDDPRGPWTSGDLTSKTKAKGHSYCIKSPAGKEHYPPTGRQWGPAKETFERMLAEGRIWFGKTGENFPRAKQYLSEVQQGIVPLTLWKHEDVGHNQEAKQELNALMDRVEFETPKPVRLISRMLQISGESVDGGDLIMDFFAGSGTTAHAVWQKTAEDGRERKFILVQLPEPTQLKDYPTIADLTKERLRRASKQVREENPLFAGDLGFRVFKLDSTNIREWDPKRDNLAASLEESVEHLKKDRSSDDILYELLLKLGLDLCVPIQTKKIGKHEVHNIGAGSLLVCLSSAIPQAEVESLALGIAGWHKELNTAGESTVVFKDSAFTDDVAKTNLAAILQQHGIETVRSL
jgi:adenine-specific DNA-methyltransferase